MIKYVMGSDSSVIDASVMNSGNCYSSGAMYWDSNQQQVKVIDSNGNATTLSGGSVNINVGSKLREMIVWFEQKKFEEQQLAQLCKEYPNLAEAKKEFDSIYNLVKEHK